MKTRSFPLDRLEHVHQDRVDRQVFLEVGEKDSRAFILKCGRLRFWSVPLDFIFAQDANGLKHVVTVNGEIFVLAHEDPKLAQVLAGTLNTIDGRILQGMCQLLYPTRKIVRQNGSNFVLDLAQHCCRKSERLFLLGGSETANALALEQMRNCFEGLQIAGFSPPMQTYPFDPVWNACILDRIEAFCPQHIVVCFGPKKQEYWIHENSSQLAALGVRCAYGLGGTIDFLSGLKPRAPKWIEFIGAEWLFRLACEPRARFGRTLKMFKMPLYVARTARAMELLEGMSRH